MRLKLLEAATADGDGKWVKYSGVGVSTLHIYGTFDSATVTISGSTNGGKTWTAYATTYTAATITSFEAGTLLIKASLSGGGTESISVDIVTQDR